jgi:hypothetical protein
MLFSENTRAQIAICREGLLGSEQPNFRRPKRGPA